MAPWPFGGAAQEKPAPAPPSRSRTPAHNTIEIKEVKGTSSTSSSRKEHIPPVPPAPTAPESPVLSPPSITSVDPPPTTSLQLARMPTPLEARGESPEEPNPEFLYDPFHYRPRLPPTDILSQKWQYQARHLIKAQAALVACQAEVLKIEQDMMWTEREMWEKEREMYGEEGEEGGPPPPSVRLPEGRDGSHTPRPPRQAMSNAPPNAPTGPPAGAIGPAPNGFRPTRGLNKYPSETTLPPKNLHRHSYHPDTNKTTTLQMPPVARERTGPGNGGDRERGGPVTLSLPPTKKDRSRSRPRDLPLRADSFHSIDTLDTDPDRHHVSSPSDDSDAIAIAAAEMEKEAHARARRQYEYKYGARSRSRGAHSGEHDGYYSDDGGVTASRRRSNSGGAYDYEYFTHNAAAAHGIPPWEYPGVSSGRPDRSKSGGGGGGHGEVYLDDWKKPPSKKKNKKDQWGATTGKEVVPSYAKWPPNGGPPKRDGWFDQKF